MKKTFFFACILTLNIAFSANANIRSTVDEFGNPVSGTASSPEMCVQLCQGYSATITECPEGYDLLTCETTNCSNYHKCEPSPCKSGYDRSFKDCPIKVQPDNYHCTKCK